METQRDLDQSSYAKSVAAETRLKAIIEKASAAFAPDPEALAAFLASQVEFERYRDSHLKLVSVLARGTVAPIIRNAEYAMLVSQRETTLINCLSDVAPDLVL
jgi:hypothetical protein